MGLDFHRGNEGIGVATAERIRYGNSPEARAERKVSAEKWRRRRVERVTADGISRAA